ncbi:MAG TPA: DUF2878 domain-containing protein [Steroidobacteraceae bacterium]|nr:DUF2878 domain-containing protein [Steroidobacteraceae bacterium]
MSALVNFILFQIGWFGCVLNASARPLTAAAIALLIVAVSVWRRDDRRGEFLLASLAAVIGTLCDSLFVMSSRLHYADALFAPLPPLWDIALWPLFATTLNGALGWLKERLRLAALLGAVAGPLAYAAAARLGAVQLGSPSSTLLLLAGAWSVLTPLLLVLARGLSRRVPQSAAVASGDHA